VIGWLSGVVRVRDPAAGTMIVDANGVGWEVIVSLQTFAAVSEVGGPVELWIHTHVREDAIILFGFTRLEERKLFRMLTSVPKVGPKVAMALLGGFPVERLVSAIAGEDATSLQSIPGIGKKTAEQTVLSLKDKILDVGIASADTPLPPVGGAPTPTSAAEQLEREAQLALVEWGFRAREAERAIGEVRRALGDAIVELDLAELLRRAMQVLTRPK
jgi:Holliday junction DNA helicase RuvA